MNEDILDGVSTENTQIDTKITWLTVKKKVKDLKFHPKNPHCITDDSLALMDLSIEEFGYVDPVIANLDDVLISGHKRILTLKQRNKDEEEIDVRVPNRLLTEEEHEKLMLIMRKYGEGETDFDVLLNNFDKDFLLDLGWSEQELHGFDGPIDDLEGSKEDESTNDPTKPKKEKEVTCPSCGHVFKIEL